MYWYYPLAVTGLFLLAGLIGFAGSNLLLPGAFKNQGWTAFCRKEFSVHAVVIALVCALLGFCCWYFDFTQFETLLWLGILMTPTVSDYRMLVKKYKALLK